MTRRPVRLSTLLLVFLTLLVGEVAGQQAPQKPSVPASSPEWDWSALGPLDYGDEYSGTLPLTNDCKVPVTVSIFTGVPGMTSNGDVSVLPGQTYDAVFRLRTPDRPDPPSRREQSAE